MNLSKRCFIGTAVAAVLACAGPQPIANYGRLPLAFEPNRGQGAASADYFARGDGYTLALSRAGVAVTTRGADRRLTGTHTVRFVGGASLQPKAQEPLPGTVNYFVGSNPRGWHTAIPTFSKVEYPRLYPGIDLIYYGNQGRLEFDFTVAANADPSRIRLAIDGPGRVRIDADGDLVAGAADNAIRQHKPVAYQTIDGKRAAVDCSYVLASANQVALKLGAYDRTRALVIDPVLSYSTFVGGVGNEAMTAVTVDATGSAYFTGFSSSGNLAANASGFQKTYAGTGPVTERAQFGDVFVAKLNPAGTAFVYATYLGGNGDDLGLGIAIDSTGAAYVTGSTRSSNFPTTTGAPQTKFGGSAYNDGFYNTGDAFVAKLSPNGTQLVYSSYLGGAGNDLGWAIAVDGNGNATVGGATQSTDFPTTANAISRVYKGTANQSVANQGDGFVTRFDATGKVLYSTYLGGRDDDSVKAIALDAQGNVYAAGNTYSPDFPITSGVVQSAFHGFETTNDYQAAAGDGFITKIGASGTIVYSTYLGGSYREAIWGIAVDTAGAAYVTGRTASTNFPTVNAVQSTYKGDRKYGVTGDTYFGDAFVAKVNAAGSALVYSTYLGGPGDEIGTAIAIDSTGNAYVTGFTTSPEFPVSSDALQSVYGGLGGQSIAEEPGDLYNTGDAFFVKLGPAGAMLYSSFFGGSRDDNALGIAVDAAGAVYMVGNTLSSTLKTTSGAVQTTYGGASNTFPRGDGFIAKFDFGGKLPTTPTKVTVLSGFVSTGVAGAVLSTPFAVQVVDANSAPVAGVTVAFTATGATVNPVSAVTDATGKATTTVTLGSAAGSGTVTATVAGLAPAVATLTINASVQLPVVSSVLNGASFTGKISAGSWISVFVSNATLNDATAQVVPYPTTLGNVRVRVNGNPIPVQAVFRAQNQINAQLPYEVAAGSATAVVEVDGVASTPITFTVIPAAPGIFVYGNNRAVVQNFAPDGTVTLNTSDNPVPAGDTILVYMTGQGPLDNPVASGNVASGNPISRATLPFSAKIGTTTVSIPFLGMTPGQVALAQANIPVPKELAPGDYTLIITINGVDSNGPQISVGPARK